MGNKSNIICGVGIRDIENDEDCPYQRRWKTMISRCYSTYVHKHRPSYADKVVYEPWLLFSTFKSWMDRQVFEGLELDKDILIAGSKIYSPETCCFVPSEVNNTVLLKAKKNSLPFGVSLTGKKFRARLFKDKKDWDLGSYETAQEAHKVWQWAKSVQIEDTIAWYATQKSFRTDVAEALTSRVWKLRINHASNVETTTI